jgi:hypothetical protein
VLADVGLIVAIDRVAREMPLLGDEISRQVDLLKLAASLSAPI